MTGRIIILTALFFSNFCAYAQNETIIRGIILNQLTNKPLEFATVQLLHLPDSSVLQTTVTNNKGKFEFKTIVAKYLLRYSFIGYETLQVPINLFNNQLLRVGLNSLGEV